MSVETSAGSPVSVERFARVFVKGPEELPSHADTYYDPEGGYYFKLHLDRVSAEEATPLISKARERFDVELVRRVTQDGFYKERVYVDDASEVPEDKKVQQGPAGGIYYETGVQRVGVQEQGEGETRNVAVIYWDDVEVGDEIVFETPGGDEQFAEIVEIDPSSEGPDVLRVQADGESHEAQPGTYTVVDGERKSEGSLTSGTDGAHNAVYSTSLPDECRLCDENDRQEGSMVCGECADNDAVGKAEGFEADVFRVKPPEDGDMDFESDVIGVGIDFPNHDVYVDWKNSAFPDELDDPHVSVYGSIDDLEQATDNRTETIQTIDPDGVEKDDSPRVIEFEKDDGQWVSFVGPRGGSGWVNLMTGEKRYQKRRPGPGPEDVDEGEFAEGWDEPPEDFSELAVGQSVELYDQSDEEYHEAQIVDFEDGQPKVDGDSLPADGVVAGEMQTSLTAVEADYDRHDEWFEGGDYTPEQYWGAVEDEVPEDTVEEFDEFEVGQEVALDLPGEDEPVSMPIYGFVDGDNDDFPASEDSLIFHYDDLEAAVGTEAMYDRWGEPGDASPTISGPPGMVGDVLLGPADEYETHEPEGSDDAEQEGQSWDEEELGEDEWLSQQGAEPGTAFMHEIGGEAHPAEVVGATSMTQEGDLSHAVIAVDVPHKDEPHTTPVHPNVVPDQIPDGPLEGQVETAHDDTDSDEFDSVVDEDVGITDVPEGTEVIIGDDHGYYTHATTYPNSIGFDPGDGDTIYPEDAEIAAVHESVSEPEESEEAPDTPPEDEAESAVAQPVSEGPEEVSQADPEDFVSAVEEFSENHENLSVMLTSHDPEELDDHDVFLADDGSAGVAVSPEGDIQNLFSADDSEVSGNAVMEQAIAAGGQTLDCYDGFLTDFYLSHDFDVTGTMDFNPEVAPEGWEDNPYLEDRPDVMFMAHEPGDVGEVPKYDGSEWAEAKDDARRAADTGADGGAEGRGVGRRPRGSDSGSSPAGGDGGKVDDYDLSSYDPDDAKEFRDMSDIGASHGNSVAAMEVAVLPDGSKAVHKDASHHSVNEDDIEREMAGYEAAKHFSDNVPEHAADVEAGWAVSEVAPGVDAKDATPEMKAAVEAEDFIEMAAKQVMIGNADLHQNNVRVDENGNLYPFDLDRAAGDITGDWVGNLTSYDDTLDRILGELETSANALGVSTGQGFRETVIEQAEEIASDIDGSTMDEIHADVAEIDEDFAETIRMNIARLGNGEINP